LGIHAADDRQTVVAAFSGNILRKLDVASNGQITDSGEELVLGEMEEFDWVRNVTCAPGGQTGVVVFKASIVSFALDGMQPIDSAQLPSIGVNAMVMSCDGTRIYVRRAGGLNGDLVDAFAYDPATGQFGNSPLFTITGIAGKNYTIAESPLSVTADGSVLIASEFDASGTTGRLKFFNAQTGAPIDILEDPSLGPPTSISPPFCCGDIDPPPPQNAIFEKEITGGPDRNNDGETDRVVEVLGKTTSEFEFTITFRHQELPPALIRDIVPAQWEVVSCVATNEDDVVQLSRSGRSFTRGNFATQIDWYPTDNDGSLVCTVKLRLNRLGKYEPASHGKLAINHGAFALDASDKKPLVDGEGQKLNTPGLFILGMKDVNRDKRIDWSGEGDEDGDTLTDWFEATEYGTDPTKKDTDGDRSPDNIDKEPLNRRKK
jgi:hypothetical protein